MKQSVRVLETLCFQALNTLFTAMKRVLRPWGLRIRCGCFAGVADTLSAIHLQRYK